MSDDLLENATEALREVLAELGMTAEFRYYPEADRRLELADTLEILERFAGMLRKRRNSSAALDSAIRVLEENGRDAGFLGSG